MPIKKLRPMTSGTRHMSILVNKELDNVRPEKSLTEPLKSSYGIDNYGHRTGRNRQKGHKRLYRIIDWKRNKIGIPAKVATLEYDPNRTANIALLHYVDGEKRYILAPLGLEVGTTLVSGLGAEIRPGNALQLKNIPAGTLVHNIELKIAAGGKMARTAGSSAQVIGKDVGFVLLRLPSGEIRKVREECYATIGQLSNIDHENVTIGKAGRSRWLGRAPAVRGTAMNPIDHPHGGGEGKTKGGRHPVSPWGMPTKGYKTRTSKRNSRFIVERKKK